MSAGLAFPRDAEAYAAQLGKLLPRGAAWTFPVDGTFAGLLLALADEMARADARGVDLFEEMDPRTTQELLADWERVAGLPDSCTGAPDSTAERQAALHQKLTSTGGQNAVFYTDVAAKLGYVIEIEEHRPCAIGMPCDVPINDQDWAFAWTVHVQPPEGWYDSSMEIAAAKIGDPVGIRLRGWGSLDLECVISRERPAQTIVLFTYEIEPEAAFWFDFTA